MTPSKVVKNRRHAYMEKLVLEGEFFSEDEMKRRDPALYEYYVGRFQSQEEQGTGAPEVPSLSQLLMKSMETDQHARQVTAALDLNPGRFKEEEEEGEEDREDEEDEERQIRALIPPSWKAPGHPQAGEPEELENEKNFVEEFDEDEEDVRRARARQYSQKDSKAWGAPVEMDAWGSMPAGDHGLGTITSTMNQASTDPSSQTPTSSSQLSSSAIKKKKVRNDPQSITQGEKGQLKVDFLHVMQHRFLEGKEVSLSVSFLICRC